MRLGALIAEARRNVVRADLGLVRNEAIRADLPAGPVTYARLAEVEPAGSDLVRVTLTGGQLTGAAGAGDREGPTGPRCTWPGRRCATIHRRGRAGASRASCFWAAARSARRSSTRSPPTTRRRRARADLAALRDLPAERAGLIDVEAVAGYLRRLPQPVEAAAAPTLVSTRR